MREFLLHWLGAALAVAVTVWVVIGLGCFLLWGTEWVMQFWWGIVRFTVVCAGVGGLWVALAMRDER